MQVLGGKTRFLTSAHDWIHDCIHDWHMGLDPEVVSRLEYEYSVNQLLSEDYIYFKWWDVGPVFASLCEKANR